MPERYKDGHGIMRIVVAGCGHIGQKLIANLVEEGHDVVVLDQSREVVSEITSIYDVMGVCGNAADYETLASTGVAQADLFIASTTSDEMNMLSCFIAKRIGAQYTVARIRNPEYNDDSLGFMKRELGLAMAINPEALAARELFDILKMPSAAKIETFSGRAFEIVELKLKEDSQLSGMTLKELRMHHKAGGLICTVQRGNDVYIPGGDFMLKSGDKIGITASPAEIEIFLRRFGMLQKKARSVMILGGGKMTYYLGKMLLASGNLVTIIENDKKTAEELNDALPGATVVHGSGSHRELLLEEGIESMDALLALTDQDERNIVMAAYAETLNVPKVIVSVDRDEMADLAEKLGLDAVISPKRTVSDVLVRYARALESSKGSNVETLYKLMDGLVEALEFKVLAETSGVTGIPLKDLNLKDSILIAGIARGRKTIVPGGDDMIMPGDRVVVLAAGHHRLADLEDITA